MVQDGPIDAPDWRLRPPQPTHSRNERQMMDDKPWYEEGLRFRCKGCGHCCIGDPGYVYVVRSEIEALAEAVEMDLAEFEDTFVRRVGRRKSLVELASGDCVFFDPISRGCRVYEARPRQCRTWPFWASNLRSRKAWEETCRACPGSGRGRLVAREEIDAQRAVVRV